jgi:hypothetical protein
MHLCRVSWPRHSAKTHAVNYRYVLARVCWVSPFAECSTLGKNFFAECFKRMNLPYVFLCRVLHENLCRVPDILHSAKLWTLGKVLVSGSGWWWVGGLRSPSGGALVGRGLIGLVRGGRWVRLPACSWWSSGLGLCTCTYMHRASTSYGRWSPAAGRRASREIALHCTGSTNARPTTAPDGRSGGPHIVHDGCNVCKWCGIRWPGDGS